MDITKDLKGFFDNDGKLKVWPGKPEKKEAVIKWLADKFVAGREYSEKEVNEILKFHNSFGDHQLLRRELYERGFMNRLPNGSKYWRSEKTL